MDLFIPDLVPFADELLLGMAAVYLGRRKKSRTQDAPEEKPVGHGPGERVKDNSPSDTQQHKQ